jgi:hypothetical protein
MAYAPGRAKVARGYTWDAYADALERIIEAVAWGMGA